MGCCLGVVPIVMRGGVKVEKGGYLEEMQGLMKREGGQIRLGCFLRWAGRAYVLRGFRSLRRGHRLLER